MTKRPERRRMEREKVRNHKLQHDSNENEIEHTPILPSLLKKHVYDNTDKLVELKIVERLGNKPRFTSGFVTVTPLSNPNSNTTENRTVDLGNVSRAVRTDTSGKRRSIKKEVLEPIFVTVDGEVIMKLVQKRLLEFAGDNLI